LLRLDVSGPPHRNPDGELIACPHLHVYREGYGDKWAIAIPTGKFENIQNRVQTLIDFMTECNVTEQPSIQTGLF